jgi:hypothetical protein
MESIDLQTFIDAISASVINGHSVLKSYDSNDDSLFPNVMKDTQQLHNDPTLFMYANESSSVDLLKSMYEHHISPSEPNHDTFFRNRHDWHIVKDVAQSSLDAFKTWLIRKTSRSNRACELCGDSLPESTKDTKCDLCFAPWCRMCCLNQKMHCNHGNNSDLHECFRQSTTAVSKSVEVVLQDINALLEDGETIGSLDFKEMISKAMSS